MNHTLTNIEKEINSYLFPCPPQLRWKSHRPPSHRHTSYFIGSSLQVFLHRHTPVSSAVVFKPPFIGILPVSSAVVFKPPFIGIDNNTSNLIGNARVQINLSIDHHQLSATIFTSRLSSAIKVFSNFPLAD